MNISNKNLTQGGQVVFYMISMFFQINKIVFKYLTFLFFILSTFTFLILNVHRFYALKMAYYYYIAKVSSFSHHNGNMTLHLKGHTFQGRVNDIINNKEFIKASEFFLNQVFLSLTISFVICFIVAIFVFRYLTNQGKKQSEDDYISGRKFEKNYKKVAKLLKKEKINSDIVIGGLPIIKDSEIQNILLHGTVGTGKSTVINQYIEQILIRALTSRGDKVIIYDRGNSFLPKFFNEDKDYILNPLDDRCAAWSLWDECTTKPEFDMFAESLVPEQGGDPFWINAPRTIISSIGYEIRNENPTYKKYLQYLLNVDLPTLKNLLKGTESENLVDGKAEKTTSSIRNVITTYAKSLAYMQGLEKKSKGNKSLVIKKWLTDPNDKGVLYITSNGAQHGSIKSLITAWLAITINSLFQLGEDRNRRVWFIVDEISSLNKIPILNTILAEGRKFGSCFLIGLQNTAQFEDIYGVKGATSLLDLLNTRYFFRSPNFDIAKKVSEQIGKTRYDVFNEQYAYGKSEVRDGVSFNKKEEEKEIVSPYDIMQLPDLNCYVTYPAQVPVTILKLKYKEYQSKAVGFIPRMLDTFIENAPNKSNKSSNVNSGQEVNFSEPLQTAKTTEKIDYNETEKKPKDNSEREIANRDEVNINEDHHDINHEYQL